MDQAVKPASSAGPAPLDQVKQSVHSDLQYVSLQVDGQTYGGWYRLLPDGQMELLALANMHCERRRESTPIEQARGMLADFVRVARSKTKAEETADADLGAKTHPSEGPRGCAPGTLGDLLYADKTKTRAAESDWIGLVQSIAAGDQLALRELYERMHGVVFTLIARLTGDRETAETLTFEVFHSVWRRAPKYAAADGSVVGWIMDQARSRVIDHLGIERRKERSNGHDGPEMLSPSTDVWGRLVQRIARENGSRPVSLATPQWTDPEWEEVAPGISCKLLATDAGKDLVSMLVRLAPGVDYPPHTHAGVEELHLLHGELLIDGRRLFPGDYNRAEPGSADKRVWSETGCMCVLMTSTRDAIG